MKKIILLFIFGSSFLYSQKTYVEPNGYVTVIETSDNILAPTAYSGIYQLCSPAEDEYGNYTGGDGFIRNLEFSIGANSQKMKETLEVMGWDSPQEYEISNFVIDGNKLTSESYNGYFKFLKYKTKKKKIVEVECLIISESGYDSYYIKIK